MMATTPLPIEPEIEITPAMIEAGRDVILRFWGELAAEPSFPLCDEVVSSIYATMEASAAFCNAACATAWKGWT